MSTPRSSVLAIWAIACWPAINFIASNWSEVQRGGLSSLTGVLAITIAMALVGHALQWYASRSKSDLIVPWVVAICLFFGYLAIRDFFIPVFRRVGPGVPPFVYWILFAAAAMGIAWWIRESVKAQAAARAFSFVAAGAALVMLAATIFRMPATSQVGTVVADLPGHADVHPDLNIYYFLLDGYAGKQSLREAMSFDNSPFLGRMASRGFRDVGSEASNYLQTSQTVGGIFSLQYPLTDDPRSWNDKSGVYPALLDAPRPPPLVARLRADGYMSWLSTKWLVGCSSRHVRCVNDQGTVDPVYMAQSFIAPTPVGRALMHIAEARRNALEPVAQNLPAMLAKHQPLFVFAHHTSPHPPYSLDRHCKSVDADVDSSPGAPVEQQRAGYVGALECVNSQVESLVEHITSLDPDALIVLQGDHGADVAMNWREPMETWTDAAIRERASYLNLVRAPARCAQWLDRPLGQVNTARFVLACAEGHAPEFLPEHTYISSYFPGPEGLVVREWRR